MTALVSTRQVTHGNPITVTITAKDDGKAAPGTIIEMEIWDASGKSVNKQYQEDCY